jgi:predicted nucleic acid-binding protein
MSRFFADTFYWIAFTNAQDDAHEKAKQFTLSAKPEAIYTTKKF